MKTLQDFGGLVLQPFNAESKDLARSYLEDYWTVLLNTLAIPPRLFLIKKTGEKGVEPAKAFREEYIIGHAVFLKALGMLGGRLYEYSDWTDRLDNLRDNAWLRRGEHWFGICLTNHNKLISNQKAVRAICYQLMLFCEVPLTDAETADQKAILLELS